MRDRQSEAESKLLAGADLCVKCGLCLPHCPTYVKTGDEGESPRGRIALMQGLFTGDLSLSPRLEVHLGNCVACRACESVCPSHVPYGELIDAARAGIARRKPPGFLRRLGRWLGAQAPVDHPGAARLLHGLLRAYQGSGLAAIRRRGPRRGLRRAAGYLPSLRPVLSWEAFYPARGAERGRVALFLGCVARVFDQPVLAATIRVLNHLGYAVEVPLGQGCCGAIHLHDGAEEQSVALAHRNLRAFGDGTRPIITTASGCGATLLEYPRLAGLSPDAAGRFAARVVDVSSFLAGVQWPAETRPQALAARVAVHEPCSLRNVMGQGAGPRALLSRVPALDVVDLPGNGRCCGAAGTYMLTHPTMADTLVADKCALLGDTGASMLVTSNVGCALHLAAALREAGSQVEVLHPVMLLARRLGIPEL